MSIHLVHDVSTIGGRLRLERDRLGLSVGAMGSIARANAEAQRRWEGGDSFPDAVALAAFATAGADILYIITGRREVRHPATTAAIIRLINGEGASALAAMERRNVLLREVLEAQQQ